MFEMADRDIARGALVELDLEAQLLVIRTVLSRNHKAEEKLVLEIKELGVRAQQARGDLNDILVNDWVNQLHGSVYLDATHSMAAAAMIAPLLEALFVAIFCELGKRLPNALQNLDDSRAQAIATQYWDPHNVFYGKKKQIDLVAGIKQLSRATDLMKISQGTSRKRCLRSFSIAIRCFTMGSSGQWRSASSFKATLRNLAGRRSGFRWRSRRESPGFSI